MFSIGCPCKPLLLFRHSRGIRSKKSSEHRERCAGYESSNFRRVRLLDDLPGFVEPLQGEQAVDEIAYGTRLSGARRRLSAIRFSRLFILVLVRRTRCPDRDMPCNLAGSACDFLLISLRRFLQFPGYVLIVVGSDSQLLPLAGMLSQLECLGEVLTGPSWLTQNGVVNVLLPHTPMAKLGSSWMAR